MLQAQYPILTRDSTATADVVANITALGAGTAMPPLSW